MNRLKQSIHCTFTTLGNLFAAAARKFAPTALTPRPAPPRACHIDPDQLPPFTGSAEEAQLLWQMPPVAIVKAEVLASVGPTGEIADSVEQIRLTAAGKVLARTKFLFLDHFGVIGRPQDLRGQCGFCGRVCFQATTCALCGRLACPECGGAFVEAASGRALYLCKAHLKKVGWHRPLWPQVRTHEHQLDSSHAKVPPEA